MINKSFLLLVLLLAGCTSVPSSKDRVIEADLLASQHGWHAIKLPTSIFTIVGYVPDSGASADNTLTVFIEGDGFAWRTPYSPSIDPTPIDPVALRLAIKHPAGNVAYLARPCQYNKSSQNVCKKKYWTDSRFAAEVVLSEDQALDQLKSRFNAQNLNLVGYSGGGAIAALLAARRNDIGSLITVAGNLDHRAWTSLHKISPLENSLNPSDYIDQLKDIKQWHFVGSNDKNIPVDIISSFANRFPSKNSPNVLVIPEFDHHCCWSDQWVRLFGLASNK